MGAYSRRRFLAPVNSLAFRWTSATDKNGSPLGTAESSRGPGVVEAWQFRPCVRPGTAQWPTSLRFLSRKPSGEGQSLAFPSCPVYPVAKFHGGVDSCLRDSRVRRADIHRRGEEWQSRSQNGPLGMLCRPGVCLVSRRSAAVCCEFRVL